MQVRPLKCVYVCVSSTCVCVRGIGGLGEIELAKPSLVSLAVVVDLGLGQ
jgi:hypothetical protein